MAKFQPMLAVDFGNLKNVRFPVLGSPKLDGIRAVNIPGVGLRTRSLKPVPNAHVNALFDRPEFAGLDGELIVGDAGAPDAIQRTTSGVMSRAGAPPVTWHVFDDARIADQWFLRRLELTQNRVRALAHPHVQPVPHRCIEDAAALLAFEAQCLAFGFEGVMLRDPAGPYKFGRSTLREGYLLKVKQFTDLEAEVVGFEERMANTNAQERDERGYAKRSSAKDGLRPTGTLGALICRSPKFDTEFNVGTGFTDADRQAIWDQRDRYLGKLAKLKFQMVGVKDAPRLPVFLGWRSPLDL